MILSVSRRTDIPAFYSEWFFERVKKGFLYIKNPMNAHQISNVKITPDVVDCIVFWTKNPAPMLNRLDELSDYSYYFQFTLNNYGTEIEPKVPPIEQRLETFMKLSEKTGKEKVIWRYDPILFTDGYTEEYHLNSFRGIAAKLKNYTEKAVVSIVDVYPSKNSSDLNRIGAKNLPREELEIFMEKMSVIAHENGLTIATCAEDMPLEKYGIEHNSCIDRKLIERITNSELDVKADGQRPYCQCVKCDDIGSYDTCPHGCVYCYANYRPSVVEEKAKLYDIDSPILCDKADPDTDKISERPVRSLKKKGSTSGSDNSDQLTLF